MSSSRDIAARVGLDAKELDKPCEESLLPSLANFVHPWRLIFSYHLAQIDLDDVETENSGRSEQEKRLACLRKWKVRCGARATCGVIVNALLKNRDVEGAEGMCRHLQEITGIKQEGRFAIATYNLFVPAVIWFIIHAAETISNSATVKTCGSVNKEKGQSLTQSCIAHISFENYSFRWPCL